ncbi:MAG: UvrD-helicase domain-containing protein [Proteobacteria bacterium]|nr:UvrD-helicase domain-containing protein [Pseudomonadota bacterium]
MHDQHSRTQALDPTQSFIVQAPAGSGKTELLTQRFLMLLSTVNKPEEIMAVTFTRKAAFEMRQRIIGALKKAALPEPSSMHEKTTYYLAKKALARDKAQGWQLQQYPNRLRILTIDAVCAFIANTMPVLSHLGSSPEIVEYPDEYYHEAVERLLKETVPNQVWSGALNKLFLHLDNRISFIFDLLKDMLSKRDQWLPYLGKLKEEQGSLQYYINQGINTLISLHLKRLAPHFDDEVKMEMMSLINYAGLVCKSQNSDSLLSDYEQLTQFPHTHPQDLLNWLIIAELLLTKEDTWRKSVTIKCGFPSPSEAKDKNEKLLRKEKKEAMLALLEHLSQNAYLRELLSELRILPLEAMKEEQSEILNALGILLPVLVAHLQVIFQEKGKIDFTEVNLRALQALGDELTPSEIILSLDYQIRHIMIDEYQDTSSIQYRLFEKLVMGWQKGDGRTLFLVGDPMQSIYKFRGAEVSLFIKTQEDGLGGVKLEPLSLLQNFRSSALLVEWVNKAFENIFPAFDEKSLGGVKYAKALAHKESENSEVTFHTAVNDEHQVAIIIDIINQQLKSNSNEHIAVLVKAKNHLVKLVSQLKQLRINFVAVEIEHLALRPHVMDLITLLRAQLDWTDKVAWFALLRAPWLGLALADLLVIAKASKDVLVWQTLCDRAMLTDLSQEALTRLNKFIPIMQFFMAQRDRHSLSDYLRGLWVSLGGPYCYDNPHLLNDIDKILNLVSTLSLTHPVFDCDELEQRLSTLYADIAQGEERARLELMTIHKAKGLEFDTVIMPHLHAKTKSHDTSLMVWFEHAHEEGIDLILAPRKSYTEDDSPLYRYVDAQIRKKTAYELSRLLYVGVTRAKKQLHLVGILDKDESSNFKKPAKGTFLHALWPYLDIKEPQSYTPQDNTRLNEASLTRLALQTSLPPAIELALAKNRQKESSEENFPPMSDWLSKAQGTVFHRLMQRENKTQRPTLSTIEIALKRQGLFGQQLSQAAAIILQAFDNMMQCETGQWILSKEHSEQRSEWPLSYYNKHGVENIVIDYSFVDKNNIRWIVDFKLTHHRQFTQEELQVECDQYRSQLEKYRKVVLQLENRHIRYGLYFPLAKKWHEYI